jgi:endoglycosylceramidase
MRREIVCMGQLVLMASLSGAGCQPEPPAVAGAGERLLADGIHPSGRWHVDAQDRVRMFRGVNIVNKLPPFTPSGMGFGEEDAALMTDAGFNLVRVGLSYAGIEPSPGRYDDAYLDDVASTVELLAAHGISSLIEFHQDLFGPAFNGDGFPEWATLTDDLPRGPLGGFPMDYQGVPAIARAFDHFWANDPAPDGVGLQDHYARAWQRVAQRFASVSGVLGYELMNEPFPGSAPCTNTDSSGCAAFDQSLGSFYNRVIPQIRQVDSNTLIYVEPHVWFTYAVQTHLPQLNDDQLGFSFHPYGVPAAVFYLANQRAASTNEALLASEWGVRTDASLIRSDAATLDQHRMSWLYWTWAANAPYGVSPGFPNVPANIADEGIVRDLTQPRTAPNLHDDRLAELARPYPRAVAGTPTSISFNADTRVFTLLYSTTSPGGRRAPAAAETEIVLPVRHYPNGYKISVSGAVASVAPGPVLRLVNNPNARNVTLQVTPN